MLLIGQSGNQEQSEAPKMENAQTGLLKSYPSFAEAGAFVREEPIAAVMTQSAAVYANTEGGDNSPQCHLSEQKPRRGVI